MTDTARFEAFVREYEDMVYGTAVRLLANPSEAEDIAQTVFLKAFQHFAQLEANPAAPGWLKTVATNLCLNHLTRHRLRWRLFSEMRREGHEEEHVEYEATLASNEESVTASFERGDEERRLARALKDLPSHQRVPIVLFHFDRLSYQDIAARLGVTLAKVKSDIHRGRETLKSVLATDHGSH